MDGKVTNYAYDAAGRLVKEGDKMYSYGWLDKIVNVQENETMVAAFDYHINGQIASATYADKTENFLWDGLALIHRGDNSYINEPYVTGGNPILSSKDGVMFNDILGTTLGIKNEKGFDAISMTAFGEPTTSQPNNSTTEIDNVGFFTGKPYIGELGYAFLFRNYRADQGKWQTKDPLGYPDGWNNLAYVNNIPLALVDPLGLSFWNSISSIASSTWNAITNVASNPTFQNSLAATSGALQVATGIVLGGTTGWTGVGAVAAGALILNGASTLAMGVTNLSAGSNFNTSGFAGALTSVMTNNPTANQLASAFDLTTNLFAGGFAVSAANSAATATILPGTMGGYLANFNLGDTAYANLLINGSTAYDPNFIVNTLTATSAISSTVNSINNIINSGGIVAE